MQEYYILMIISLFVQILINATFPFLLFNDFIESGLAKFKSSYSCVQFKFGSLFLLRLSSSLGVNLDRHSLFAADHLFLVCLHNRIIGHIVIMVLWYTFSRKSTGVQQKNCLSPTTYPPAYLIWRKRHTSLYKLRTQAQTEDLTHPKHAFCHRLKESNIRAVCIYSW